MNEESLSYLCRAQEYHLDHITNPGAWDNVRLNNQKINK